MQHFTVVRDIMIGRDAVSALSRLSGARAAIVLGAASARQSGALRKVQEALAAQRIGSRVMAGATPDKSGVLSGAKSMREYKPDWIIALGGGSVLDAAKGMWLFYEHPELDYSTLYGQGPLLSLRLRTRAHFAALPTTLSSGGEVSPDVMLLDADGMRRFRCEELLPDIALLDAAFLQSLPAALCAQEAFYGFACALEAYMAPDRSDFTDALALQSAASLFNALESGVSRTRPQTQESCLMAGLAACNTAPGFLRNACLRLSAAFSVRIPFGTLAAIALPNALALSAQDGWAQDRLCALATAAGLEHGDAQALASRLRAVAKRLRFPASLRAAGVSEAEFMEKAPPLAQKIAEDRSAGHGPEQAFAKERESILSLLMQLYGKSPQKA